MISLMTYLFEVSVCLASFYVLYIVAFARLNFFNLNRWYMLAGLILSFAIPAIHIQSTFSPSEGIYTILLDENTIGVQSPLSSLPFLSWINLLGIFYMLGVFVATFKFVRHFWHVIMLIKTAEHKLAKPGYQLVKSSKTNMIGSFFRYILWNTSEQLSKEQKQLIISHELTHVKEGHSFDIILIELAGIILWFNPFIYLLKKSIRVNHEFIADNIAAETDTTEYVNLLANQVLSANGLSLTSFFDSNQIINRMRMMKTNNARSAITRYLLITPLVFALIVMFSCENGMTIEEDANEEYEEVRDSDQETALNQPTIFDPFDEEELVLLAVDDNPEFPGGIAKFYEFVAENIKYPAQARRMGIEGKVFVEFIVDKTGKLHNFKLLKGIGAGCDAEAVNVISKSPIWIPGSYKGEDVNVRMVLPITFRLD